MADISYNKTTWVNGSTALNAANLNNIEIGVDSATKAINNKVDKEAGKGLSTHDFNDHYKNIIDNLQGEGGISVIELTDKNGTIASTQLGEINANPQNFAFKYSGKILSFTKADSTTYQYWKNTTNGTDNSVITTSTFLTIELSTGAYTIAENVHSVVANSIHPVNGGDLTNIQVGSKVYSIPSGGGGGSNILRKDGTFVRKEADGTIINTISLSSEESTKIRNGEITTIYGVFNGETGSISDYKVDFTKIIDNMYIYANTDINDASNETTMVTFQLVLTEETASLYRMKITHPSIPALPTDAASKTYTLQTVNGVSTWNTIGGYVKIFQPTITNVNINTLDGDKRITVVFTANNEVETYIHSLVDHGKNFSANLFLKTLTINDYQIRLISPLSLINIRGGDSIFVMGGRLIQDSTSKIDFKLTFNTTGPALTFYFDNNDVYTQFKQLASLLFTTDTLLKLTIKTDE